MFNSNCPSDDQLQSYLLGQCAEEEIEEVAQHVETCGSCESTIARFDHESDTLIAALRSPINGEYAANDQCQRAIAFVKEIGREPTGIHAASKAASTLPVRQLRDYELLEKLGEGGMGAVYKARHFRLDKIVAIKILPADRTSDDQALARFHREMRAVGKLDHPNIVRAMDAGEVDEIHFLVMEYVRGCDLAELLRLCGPLPMAEACELIRQAAIGLQDAHENGMVHRDIKPSNLMLDWSRKEAPTVKILDLGLALLETAPQNHELTAAGQMMGTWQYMAPEQGLDSHDVDIRADLYSLGATLFKLLTGVAPFSNARNDTPLKLMRALANDPPPLLSAYREDLPPELVDLVNRLLAKSPDERLQTPKQLADALTPFSEGAELAALLDIDSSDADRDVTASLAHSTPTVSRAAADQADDTSDRRQAIERKTSVTGTRTNRLPRIPIAVTGCALAAIAIVLVVIIRLQTREGQISVEIAADYADQVQVVARGDSEEVVISKQNQWEVRLKDGTYRLALLGGEEQLTLDDDTVEVRRGHVTKVVVRFVGRTDELVRKTKETDAEAPVNIPDRELFTNSIGMPFVRVPRGTFWMSVSGRNAQKELEIPYDFYIGRFEVTQEQWKAVMGQNPSSFSREGAYSERVKEFSDEELARFPVEYVSVADINNFLERLNSGEDQPNWSYRLPTVVEWEYACRGANPSKEHCSYDYYFDEPTNRISRFDANVAGTFLSRPVGSYKPNSLGLYDMHGNVWEWTMTGLGWGRIIKGGSSIDAACRTATIESVSTADRRSNRGFRLVMAPRDAGKEANIEPPLERPELRIEPLPPRTNQSEPETVAGEVFTNSIGMKFVHVPMNIFWMSGSGKNAQREVEIPYDYQIGVHEVTQQQWLTIMDENPSFYSRTGEGKAAVEGLSDEEVGQLPVHAVPMDAVKAFIEKLTDKENEQDWIYRLPSEEEWEFACRGGATTRESCSFDFYLREPAKTLMIDQACFGGQGPPRPVGSYLPNALGIYDMHGNVSERVSSGMAFGRYLLGGSWLDSSENCRAAARPILSQSQTAKQLGLRLVRVRKQN